MLKKKYEVAYMYKNKKVCIKRVISRLMEFHFNIANTVY